MNIPITVKLKITKKFEESYIKAIEESVAHIVKNIKNEIPSVTGNTQNKLKSNIFWDKGYAIIGWDSGSKEELVGSVLQYGSGYRGKSEYQTSRFGEPAQDYTIPIVPVRAKAMSFIDKNGTRRYMKSFIGHPPRYVMTKGLINSMKFLPIIIDNAIKK